MPKLELTEKETQTLNGILLVKENDLRTRRRIRKSENLLKLNK